ncbi:Ca-activated chloride channel family protein [Chitinophaga jiangningensis]|uniref:Ca-activated chloride channel family protein n=1 Tax=Chitinophaga jiangningensis TaxID=1419482 RepID=A0A1M7LMG5_9BACT|nr:VWA domain-containing protein [Chitinophaga jiangningensis]SHM79375.1 Ca-activated chloride channel family protein [Chitinophaga jiangningensis]
MHLEIAYKWVFLLLPLPLLIYFLLPAWRRRSAALLLPHFGVAAAAIGHKPRKRAWVTGSNVPGWIVLFLTWACILAAAASPRYVSEPEKVPKTVRSFLIAADISGSMSQPDWIVRGKHTTRWDAVKQLMSDFVKRRKSDQMGLVVFGSNAYLQAPLTADLNMITWLLNQTEVGMAGQMTNIGDAIAFSTRILKADTLKQKILLLLTDGVDTGADISPLDAATSAAKDSITIYTLGIGQASGSGGYDLDENTLKSVAKNTGGRYFNAMNEKELEAVYQMLDKLAPVEYLEQNYKPVELLYYYPLAAGLLLVLLYYFLLAVYLLAAKNWKHA